jgi:hypothetical protein
MPVNSKHPDYENMSWKWDLVRSVVNNDARKWIRTIDVNDFERSNHYKDDAILTNFTRLTKIGLTGLVFRRPANMNLVPGIEYVLKDITGYGFGLEQLAQQVIGEVLVTGRYGLMVDYPPIENSENYARIKPYNAESVINWHYREINSEYRLDLVVLYECLDELDEDGFTWVKKDQYRVLYLNNENIYEQAIYNCDLEKVGPSVMPLDYHSQPFDEIPFVFVGADNNDSSMDNIPLYDLAVVNLGHYRNSADYEESIFICGQPCVHVNLGDTNQAEFEQANPGGIKFGARGGVITNGGSMTLVQANPNQLASVAMTEKKADAASIGARLIAPPGGRETAEAARIRFGAQNSSLYIVTKNVSLAFELCLQWIAEFMLESPSESEFELNNQFYEEDADPNLIASEMMLFDRGLMTSQEIRMNLDKSGIQLGDTEPDPIDPMIGIDSSIEGTPVKSVANNNGTT